MIIVRLLLITCIMTPFVFGFIKEEGDTLFIIETIIDVIFGIDIYMNFKFAYINASYEIVDDKKVTISFILSRKLLMTT